MKNKIGLKDIDYLDLDKNVLEKLKLKFNKVYELCLCNRSDLKRLGLSPQEINHVVIKLQLAGIDLNKKLK